MEEEPDLTDSSRLTVSERRREPRSYKMKSLLIALFLLITTGCSNSFSVIGYTGGSVFISCKCAESCANNDKYFCIETLFPRCKDLIKSKSKNIWEHNGRFSLYDNSGENYFSVVMRDLTREDTKKYRCGVDVGWFSDKKIAVDLSVMDAPRLQTPVVQTAPLGGRASISCSYSSDHRDSIKTFCREEEEEEEGHICTNRISLLAKDKSLTTGRFSLADSRSETFYTVTISNLTEKDAGRYWCAVEGVEDEGSYKALITQVVLSVTVPLSTTPALTTTISTTTEWASASSITALVPADTCSSSSSSSSSPPSPASSTEGIQVITRVCVSLAVLLLSLTVLIVIYTQRNRKSPGAATFSDGKNTNTRAHKNDHSVYEEIAERPLQPDSGTIINSVNATVTLPTTPSASPNYASVSFHKSPNFTDSLTH